MLEGSIPASYQHERSILQVNFLAQFDTQQNNHFLHNLQQNASEKYRPIEKFR